jgi:hypothetical protein
MTAQINGYTVEIINKDGESAFSTPSYPRPPAGMATSTYEAFVWDQLDNIVSFFTTNNPSFAPYSITMVQRNEFEDVNLTHP